MAKIYIVLGATAAVIILFFGFHTTEDNSGADTRTTSDIPLNDTLGPLDMTPHTADDASKKTTGIDKTRIAVTKQNTESEKTTKSPHAPSRPAPASLYASSPQAVSTEKKYNLSRKAQAMELDTRFMSVEADMASEYAFKEHINASITDYSKYPGFEGTRIKNTECSKNACKLVLEYQNPQGPTGVLDDDMSQIVPALQTMLKRYMVTPKGGESEQFGFQRSTIIPIRHADGSYEVVVYAYRTERVASK